MKTKFKEVALAIGQAIGIALSIFIISYLLFAQSTWQGPTSSPPGGNIPAPLSSGSETQFKEGALGVGGVFEAFSLKLNPDGAAKPTCDASMHGMMWADIGPAGEGDRVVYCSKTSADTYEWAEVASKKIIQASGGDEVYDFVGDGTTGVMGQKYRVHAFTTVGTQNFNIEYAPGGIAELDVLVVGGGGSGGQGHAGGGGGGGVILLNNAPYGSGTLEVKVGAGAPAVATGGNMTGGGGRPGEDSSFAGLTALGGARGGNDKGTNPAGDGGSGGGGGG